MTHTSILPSHSKQLIDVRKLSWLDHAERHFKDGYLPNYDTVCSADEHLMYLALFAYVGMFD